jgi:methylated-DNA-protein-cysteine methyltransferase related protein
MRPNRPRLYQTKGMSFQSKSNRRKSSTNGVFDQLSFERSKRSLLRDSLRPNEECDIAFRKMILSIPASKVSTYGGVGAAAGYPRHHRAVARLLRLDPVDQLPWHRVVGAGGEIKLRGDAAREQRARLKLEGVEFDGKRVNMDKCEHPLKPWEVYGGD